jgi:hypothetical protein
MVKSMKDSLDMEKSMVKEESFSLMESTLLESLRMIWHQVLVCLEIYQVVDMKVSGPLINNMELERKFGMEEQRLIPESL